MDLSGFKQLLSDEGQAVLRRVAELGPSAATLLRDQERLAREFRADLARWALHMGLLRVAARKKFRHADLMYFTREALEQATGDLVAEHRARRFLGFDTIGDLCCGIGGDTIALAQHGTVYAVDIDPLRLAMARANAQAVQCPKPVHVIEADVTSWTQTNLRAVFIDPDRRRSLGRRHVRLEDYSPPISVVCARCSQLDAWAVKVAPAVPWHDLESLAAEVEFISVGGELKEGVLWFGAFRGVRRRATVLPSGTTLAADEPAERSIGPIRSWIHDPDPAVTRAGLVTNLGHLLHAHLIDAQTAFLTGDEPSGNALARSYRVEAVLPFKAQMLRDYLRSRRVGRVTWLKRGHAADVGALTRQMKLNGEEHRIVLLMRIGKEPMAVVATPKPTG